MSKVLGVGLARKPRFSVPGVAQHITQRGNNRCATFSCPRDYHFYLECLVEAAHRFECRVHAYVLMTNHVHILATPDDESGISRMMQRVAGLFTSYYNKCDDRTGTLWDGRFKSALVDSEAYLFNCMRYIELNPLRAGMVERPGQYKWSSFLANANGYLDRVITPHARYLDLGPTKYTRCEQYSRMFDECLSAEIEDEIRNKSARGQALGGVDFVKRIAAASGTRNGGV